MLGIPHEIQTPFCRHEVRRAAILTRELRKAVFAGFVKLVHHIPINCWGICFSFWGNCFHFCPKATSGEIASKANTTMPKPTLFMIGLF